MTDTRMTIEEAQKKVAQAIKNAPREKQEDIRIFLEGFAAGLEHMLEKKEAS